MGADRSRAGAEVGLRALNAEGPQTKAPPDRLYGRLKGHRLRPRQVRLLAQTLPRVALTEAEIVNPPSPLWLEIGFGGGEHALALAAAHPEATLIACEVFENGVCSLLSRLVAEGEEASGEVPANLRLWDRDARPLLQALPEQSVDRLFLMFPDPWPKSRHAKRRFVHPAMLPKIARILRPGGEWRIGSDEPTYQAWVDHVLANQTLFAVTRSEGERPAGWPPTRYEAKARREGRTPAYWQVIRQGQAVNAVCSLHLPQWPPIAT